MISQDAMFDFSKFGSRVVCSGSQQQREPTSRRRRFASLCVGETQGVCATPGPMEPGQKLMFLLGNALGYYRNT